MNPSGRSVFRCTRFISATTSSNDTTQPEVMAAIAGHPMGRASTSAYFNIIIRNNLIDESMRGASIALTGRPVNAALHRDGPARLVRFSRLSSRPSSATGVANTIVLSRYQYPLRPQLLRRPRCNSPESSQAMTCSTSSRAEVLRWSVGRTALIARGLTLILKLRDARTSHEDSAAGGTHDDDSHGCVVFELPEVPRRWRPTFPN